MKVLNIGSLNIDYVYNVDHILLPGETLSTGALNIYLGGKGINQTIAARKAGVDIYHAGLVGEDGQMFLDACKEYGVHDEYIRKINVGTGHAIIQVDKNAQNSILLYGGANQELTEEYVDDVISNFDQGDILMLQNEVNLMPYIIDKAYEAGMQIVLNPSPFNEKLIECDMSKVSVFILNEVEGAQIANGETDSNKIIDEILNKYPNARIVLTLGKDGAIYADSSMRITQPIFEVKAVDTTAAGDTFTGYFIAGLVEKMEIRDVMRMAAKASSIAVTRAGAVQSIPTRQEVECQVSK